MTTAVKPNKAKKFFAEKMDFTTGPVELNGMIDCSEEITVIDVRVPRDFTHGHVPHAVNLPKERWETFDGLDKHKTNVIYCYNKTCHLAATAALLFSEHGFPVMEMEGGFDTWKQYNLPIEEG